MTTPWTTIPATSATIYDRGPRPCGACMQGEAGTVAGGLDLIEQPYGGELWIGFKPLADAAVTRQVQEPRLGKSRAQIVTRKLGPCPSNRSAPDLAQAKLAVALG
jgi:hypothetical protein